jgi:hypothetical protein
VGALDVRNGKWTGEAYVGQRAEIGSGEAYEIGLFVVPRQTSERFNEYLDRAARNQSFHGVDPSATTLLTRISVTRAFL